MCCTTGTEERLVADGRLPTGVFGTEWLSARQSSRAVGRQPPSAIFITRTCRLVVEAVRLFCFVTSRSQKTALSKYDVGRAAETAFAPALWRDCGAAPGALTGRHAAHVPEQRSSAPCRSRLALL